MDFLRLLTLAFCFVSSQANSINSDGSYNKGLETLPNPDLSRLVGNIMLPEEMGKVGGINLTKHPDKKWPKNVVPYVISPLFTPNETDLIKRGIYVFSKNIECVEFKPLTLETDSVLFTPGPACYAFLGRQGGVQQISLDNSCKSSHKIIQHLMMHTIGVIHEHNRPDRDDYVEVLWKNIPEDMKKEYEKVNASDYQTFSKYDFESFMHYPVKVRGSNKKAFILKDKTVFPSHLGNKYGPTRTDRTAVKKMYGCDM